MDPLTFVLKARALKAKRALPLNTAGRWHVSDCPLFLVTALRSGEDATLLAFVVADGDGMPKLDVTVDPRNRDGQYDLFMRFGLILREYFEKCSSNAVRPQIIVPNDATIRHLEVIAHHVLGLSVSQRLAEADPALERRHRETRTILGGPLAYMCYRVQQPGQQLLVPAATLLTALWATGQSALEDQQLSTVLAWIDGRSPDEAEDGPTSPRLRPAFDRDVYAPILKSIRRGSQSDDAPNRLREALSAQLLPILNATRRAAALARSRAQRNAMHLKQLSSLEEGSFQHYFANRDVALPRRSALGSVSTRAFEVSESMQGIAEHLFAKHDPLTRLRMTISGDLIVAEVLATKPAGDHVLVKARIDPTSLAPRKNDDFIDQRQRKLKVIACHLTDGRRELFLKSKGVFQVGDLLEMIESNVDVDFISNLRRYQAAMHAKPAWVRDGLQPILSSRLVPDDLTSRLEAMQR